jgi:hypothetical protein
MAEEQNTVEKAGRFARFMNGMRNFVLGVLVATVGMAAFPWQDKKGTTDKLEAAGYTSIDIGDRTWLGCPGKLEFVRTKFNAVSPEGKKVYGTDCRIAYGVKSTINWDNRP